MTANKRSRGQQQANANKPSRGRGAILPVIVAVGALVVAGLMAFGGGDSDQQVSSGSKETAPVGGGSTATTPAEVAPTSMGAADAPVVMVAYSEFQCPFCGKFANDTLPELIERYVDQNVLRIEWRDLPYLGDESFRAAYGARAAAEQGAFWDFHDALFADQAPKPNSGRVTDEYVVAMAGDLGLDVDEFEADYRSAAVEGAVDADRNSGIKAGVNGTPAFFVNGTPIFGAQPLEVFVETIEAAADAS